jgi:type I restriction enzyme S subunit
VSDLPPGWLETSVGNVASDVAYGFTASADWDRVGPHMLRITDIQDNKVDWPRVPYCKIPDEQKSHYLLRPADILFARTGATVGKSFRISGQIPESVFASYLIRVRCSLDDLSRYLAYYFQSPGYWEQVTASSAGTGQPNVNGTKLKALRFPLAPAPQQLAITNKLDNIVEKISSCRARLDRVPQILNKFRQAVLEAAVSGRLTEEWRGGPKLTGWVTKRAAEVCAVVQSGGTPKAGFVDMPGVPFLKVYNIVDQHVAFDYRPQYVPRSTHDKELRKSRTLPGDVLMNIVGPPLGKVAVVPDTYPEWNINQAITLFRPGQTVSTSWIYAVLCSGRNVAEVVHQTRGSVGQVNISLSQCRDFDIPVPPPEEQAEIVRRVNVLFLAADRLERTYDDAAIRVAKLTPSVLAKAFRGELVPQDPNDEPAGVMLERLQAQCNSSDSSNSQSKGKGRADAERVGRSKSAVQSYGS